MLRLKYDRNLSLSVSDEYTSVLLIQCNVVTLQLSETVEKLECTDCWNLNSITTGKNIRSVTLRDISNFLNIHLQYGLETLSLSYVKLPIRTTVFPDSLKSLTLANCNLTELFGLPENLQFLDCHYNKITELPKLPNLVVLYCTHNNLTMIPYFPKFEY